MPITIGKSALKIDCTPSRPTPGRLNTFSVMNALPMYRPRSSPNIVTTGVSAERRPWWKITVRSDSPFARAVRM